jgi:hypothetical protein
MLEPDAGAADARWRRGSLRRLRVEVSIAGLGFGIGIAGLGIAGVGMDGRITARAKRSGRMRRALVGCVCLLTLVLGALPAAADRYDPQEAGHPARIAAYVLHPVGVILDLLIFRPAHWVGSHEPLATLFGHELYDD